MADMNMSDLNRAVWSNDYVAEHRFSLLTTKLCPLWDQKREANVDMTGIDGASMGHTFKWILSEGAVYI